MNWLQKFGRFKGWVLCYTGLSPLVSVWSGRCLFSGCKSLRYPSGFWRYRSGWDGRAQVWDLQRSFPLLRCRGNCPCLTYSGRCCDFQAFGSSRASDITIPDQNAGLASRRLSDPGASSACSGTACVEDRLDLALKVACRSAHDSVFWR